MALMLTEEMQTAVPQLREDGKGGFEVVSGGVGVVFSVQTQTAQLM